MDGDEEVNSMMNLNWLYVDPYILNELGVGYRMIDEDPESRQTAEEGV